MKIKNKLFKSIISGLFTLGLIFWTFTAAFAGGGNNALIYDSTNGAVLTTISESTTAGQVSSTGEKVSDSSNIGVNPTIKLMFNLNVAGNANNLNLITLADSKGNNVPITVWEIWDQVNYPNSDEKKNLFFTPVNPLTPGEQYFISIDANLTANNGNKLGTTQTTKFAVSTDITPPALTISQPVDSVQTNQDKITVSGTTEAGSTVKVNNNSVTVNPEGSFSTEVALTAGLNTITVTSIDIVGNSSEAKIPVTYDNSVSSGSGTGSDTGSNTGGGTSGDTGNNTGSGTSGDTGINTGSGTSGGTGSNTGGGTSGDTGSSSVSTTAANPVSSVNTTAATVSTPASTNHAVVSSSTVENSAASQTIAGNNDGMVEQQTTENIQENKTTSSEKTEKKAATSKTANTANTANKKCCTEQAKSSTNTFVIITLLVIVAAMITFFYIKKKKANA